MNSSILFLFLVFAIGVFGDTDVSVSVMEGDSVTLNTGVSEIQSKDVIEWRFGGNRIAKISSSGSSIDEAFGNRLQLDSQTGDLKITNIKTTDSGEYTLKIRRSSGSSDMAFNVSVVSADAVKPISLLMGDSVTLRTGLTDIQRYDVIRWRFDHQNSPIAEIDRTAGIFNTFDSADGRFRDRLKLDNQTGSLTITNTTTTDDGLYEVEISSTSSRYTIHHTQSFSVTVSAGVESVSVLVGDSVTLHTGLTKTQRIEQILWKFGDHGEIIAHLNGIVNKTWSNIDLNLETRDLNISNIQINQSGHYKVEIITRRMILHRKYRITIDAVKSESVKEGDPVTLPTTTKIQNDDLILWMFGSIRLAEINKTEQRFHIYDGPDERFRGRLKLDHQTESLNITNTKTTDSGLYELKIISSRCTILRRITVTVTATDINTAYIPHGTTSSNNYSATDINTAYIPHGTSSSNNYSAVPDSGLSPGAVAGIVVAVILVAAAVVAAFVMYFRCKSSKLERQSAVAGIAVAVCVILVAAAVIAAVVINYRRRNSSELERQSAVAMIGVAVGGLVAAVVVAVVINYRRRNSSELERQYDRANEGTELTNSTSNVNSL